ncbi:Hypothetical protein R9X50_00594900 [Acrodontium crateriforme]|uniref:Uncharacterized protein n=1 Tax=Acrodontium crateriforme TaxID=150365 RepID=A0AAQ3RBW9_9PEZI|nr:Hypothetical protein R9X50_00594900 [Acrodontium crateriforme]
MARSPSDATHFTSTGPYVSTKPSTGFSSNPSPATAPIGSRINVGGPAPSGETPQQKIARLRAAAAASKRGSESGMDSAVRIGRVWADRAHRFTAIGLIGLTVVSGIVATAGIGDMLLHNRRRRNEWLAEQQAKTAAETAEAKKALARGDATEDQRLLINREAVAAQAAEEKKNRPGVFTRTTSWLFSGLAKEDQKGGRLGAAASNAADSISETVNAAITTDDSNTSVLQAVQEKVAANRSQQQRLDQTAPSSGGPLDRHAQATSDAISTTTRSWTSWMTTR